MYDAIVVGAGIIGATVTKALRGQGRNVLLLDNKEPMAGTAPSGGHIKPNWIGGMARKDYNDAMEMLAKVWTIEEAKFTVRPTWIKATVYRVDTDIVLAYGPYLQAKVTKVITDTEHPTVEYVNKGATCSAEAELLVIAAGVWCDRLVPSCVIQPKQGVSFRFPGTVDPFIQPWAPYKQVVVHQQGPNELWAGDGSAIIPQNWDDNRTRKCIDRCRNAIGLTGVEPLKILLGLRPYCETNGKPCLLRPLGEKSWVATGAAKLGTIAAGWVAKEILDATS